MVFYMTDIYIKIEYIYDTFKRFIERTGTI